MTTQIKCYQAIGDMLCWGRKMLPICVVLLIVNLQLVPLATYGLNFVSSQKLLPTAWCYLFARVTYCVVTLYCHVQVSFPILIVNLMISM